MLVGASGSSKLTYMSQTLFHNLTFWSGFTGWMAAQLFKLIRNLIQTKKVDFTYFVSTGGMPSAHSALVCALATSVGLAEGFGSTIFAVALAFAGVVMFDAQGVRRAAGLQAKLMNQIIQELFREHHLSQTKLAELLGHTRLEVFFGLLLGVVCALAVHGVFS